MKLYEVDEAIRNLIEDMVDPETGELPEEADAAIERLQLDKDQVILHLAALAKEADLEADAIKGEADRMMKRSRAAENRSNRLRLFINEHLAEGRKLKDTRVSLYWGTSRGGVEILPEAPPVEEWPAIYTRVKVEPDREALRSVLEPQPGQTIDHDVAETVRLFARIAPGKRYLVIR